MFSSNSPSDSGSGIARISVLTALFLAAVISGSVLYLSGQQLAGILVALVGAAMVAVASNRGGRR